MGSRGFELWEEEGGRENFVGGMTGLFVAISDYRYNGIGDRTSLSSMRSELPLSSRCTTGGGPLLPDAEGHFLKKFRRPFGDAVEFPVELVEVCRSIVLFSDRPMFGIGNRG